MINYKIFGCKVNKYYLNQWLAYFDQEKKDMSSFFLVATCVVTDRAKNKRLKEVKKALQAGKEVYITGCGTLNRGIKITDEEFYSYYPELFEFKNRIFLLGEAPSLSEKGFSLQGLLKNIYTRKYVVIQNGCDNHCTFCLTVKKRGKHWSRPIEEIIEEIKIFEQGGGKEIILTGINVGARGCEDSKFSEETKFPFLLKEILKKTSLPRIRISSLGPEYLHDDFFEVVQDPRILPYFHLSIQSFSDKILKLMKRNYDSFYLKSVLSKFQKLGLKKGLSLGGDIIVGFPGETSKDFEETLFGIREFNLVKIHSFPFSEHAKGEFVPASFFGNQISKQEKKERNKKLLSVANFLREQFIQDQIGKKKFVLIEKFYNGKWYGRTEDYILVGLEGDFIRGEIVEIVLDHNFVVNKFDIQEKFL